MNIVILSNRDLASNFALNLLLPQLSAHKVQVFLSSSVGKKNTNKPYELALLSFVEQQLFNQAIFPLIDKNNASKHSSSQRKTFEQLSDYLVHPVTELNDINSATGLNIIANSAPDLIISIRYGVILKNDLLAIPKLGVINLHSGLLPNYRGVMATFWALLNGDKNIGTTLHYINDATIDTGNIIATTQLAVNPNHSYLWHVLQLYKEGTTTIAQSVAKLSSDKTLASLPQAQGGNYYTFPTADALNEFKQKGFQLFKPEEILTFIDDFI